ncbi:MAG TPA: cephalosporin hydroxylase family protein [Gammaproteobacteria bacterium]|nr:cephalosporin hydroxylase family protein [Gammaproteobacteria bacterium]
MSDFREESKLRAHGFRSNAQLTSATRAFVRSSNAAKYSYNFFWQGRPIIQYPQDMVAIQELIWDVRPDLIIETGIAHGGSLVLSASLLTLLDYYDAVSTGGVLDPQVPRRKVLGVDIDIRPHNRAAIEAHPLSNRIEMLQGSSVAPEIIAQVTRTASFSGRVLVLLDSNHTHEHVLAELEAYAPLVSPGSFCVVFDSVVEDLPADFYPDRDWGPGNNPKTALHEYLRRLRDEGRRAIDGKPLHFMIDKEIEDKLLITVAPDGYLRRI